MYRKSLLALMILTTFPVSAATDKTIYVTTLEDEDGENANTCSLREAVKASADKRAYGGCAAGQPNVTDQIKLKGGVYKLKKPLIVGSSLIVTGDDAVNYNSVDVYANTFPARSELKTSIEGNGSFSLFDSTNSRSVLNLTNLILRNGGGTYGGAIRAGGTVNLNRVYILNSRANLSGGAIYLEGSEANLSANDSLFEGNDAKRGAVIGMSCIDNIKWTPHSITLDRNSIIKNGSAGTQNIIEYCGTAVSTINASTIAQNTSRDAIIKYTHDEINKDYVLHPTSILVLNSNTIVQNTTNSVLLYDNVGKLNLSNSVIAYNNGGKSCRYAVAQPKVALNEMVSSNIAASYNALKKPVDKISNVDDCDLPGHLYKADANKFVDVSTISFASLLNTLSELKEGILPFYLPKLKPANTSAISLVDAAEGSCSSNDQRGLARNVLLSSNTAMQQNKCDIGSIEIAQLRTIDATNISNTSIIARIKQYQDGVDYYQEILDSKDLDKNLINRYKKLRDDDTKALKAIKENLAYRQAYVNIFEVATPQEVYNSAQTATTIERFDDNKYDIKVEAVGRGSQQFIEKKDETSPLIDTSQRDNIACKWNADLKQVLVRRTDNIEGKPQAITTPAGEYEYCKFTISLKSNPDISSTSYIQTRIVNIAPVANDDTFNVKYGSNQEIQLNILANDNDNGDGELGIKGYPSGRKPFFEDASTGRFANIKLVKKPELGKLSFEYQQPCPDNSATRPEETCYGGKIIYKANNIFSTFNDSFSYKVLDQDLLESNEANVEIINTATTSDDTRKSGGGSLGLFSVLSLLSLGYLRRKLK